MAFPKIIVAIAGGTVVAAAVTIGVVVPSNPSRTSSSPTGLNTTCGADDTAALNTYFAGLGNNVNVTLPANACLLVSNGPSSILSASGLTNVTINGNGATLEQNTYNDGVTCGTDPTQPVLTLSGDTNVTVENLTMQGPSSSGGSACEGDYGVMIGNTSAGNNGITLSNDTITTVMGDGFAVYGNTATLNGMNNNVVIDNSTIENVGYHAFTLEAVNGFNFSKNTLKNVQPADFEVDFGSGSECDTNLTCFTNGKPGIGELNVAIVANSYVNASGFVEETQDCVPVENWTFANNTFDSSSPFVFQSAGSANCSGGPLNGQPSGFVNYRNIFVQNNTSTNLQAQPIYNGDGVITISGWKNVSLTGNDVGIYSGLGGSQVTVNDGVLTNGSATVTSATANFTQYINSYGLYVSATGLPNESVSSVTSATAVVMAAAATTSGTGVSLQITKTAYGSNTAADLAAGICNNSGTIAIKGNTFNNAGSVWADTGCSGTGSAEPNLTTPVACGNTYGLSAPYSYWTGPPFVDNPAPAANPITDTTCT